MDNYARSLLFLLIFFTANGTPSTHEKAQTMKHNYNKKAKNTQFSTYRKDTTCM